MTFLAAIFIGVLGAAIGSFLSVVTFRVKKKKKGIFFGNSMCPHCKKPLKWRHLIPVFSFLFLRGRCGLCGKKISAHYFAMEVLTAAVFVLTFLHWNFVTSTPSLIDPNFILYGIDWHIFEKFTFYAIEMVLLMAIFFYDLLYREIPDRFSLPAIVLGIFAGVLFGVPSLMSMGIGILIIAFFFGGQILISKGAWLGGGDLRLGAILAVLLGWELMVLALITSYVFGALVSIVLLLSKKADRKTAIPFGPFLITGGLIALFIGEEIINFYLSTIGW